MIHCQIRPILEQDRVAATYYASSSFADFHFSNIPISRTISNHPTTINTFWAPTKDHLHFATLKQTVK